MKKENLKVGDKVVLFKLETLLKKNPDVKEDWPTIDSKMESEWNSVKTIEYVGSDNIRILDKEGINWYYKPEWVRRHVK